MKKTIIILLVALLGKLAIAQDVESFQKKGETLMNDGDMAGALVEFKKAIEADADKQAGGLLYSYAGLCAQQTGNNPDAKTFFNEAINRGFKDEKVFEILGSILSKEKDYDAQIELYKKAIEIFPDNAPFYKTKLCNSYYYGKKYDQVEPLATEILTTDSKNIKVRTQLANSYLKLKKQKEALAAFEEVIKLDPENLLANKYLGNYYYQVGKIQIDKQNKKYEAIANPDRVQWTANNKKIEALISKYYVKAIPYLEKAYSQKQEASVAKMLFVIYTKKGDKEKAAKYQQ